MKKYVVEYRIFSHINIVVEAENEDEAANKALEIGDDIREDDFDFESDVEVIGVKKDED